MPIIDRLYQGQINYYVNSHEQNCGHALTGFSKSVQIMPIGANVSEILNYAMFAAHDATLLKVKNNNALSKVGNK